MTVYLLDSVKVSTSTTGTGTVTVGAADTGYLTPAEAGAVDGRVYTWRLDDGSDFEIFRGTYSSTGPTVSRDMVLVSKIGGTAGTSKINLSGTAKLSMVPTAEHFRSARRVGEFFWYFADAAPHYALVCDGSEISRTTYADLWAFAQTSGNLAASEGVKEAGQFGPGNGTTTFTLPDLTTGAEFIRAVTSGRDIGTWQGCEVQEHNHQTMHTQNEAAYGYGTAQPIRRYAPTVSHNQDLDGALTSTTGGTETRPRNIALLPCIVY